MSQSHSILAGLLHSWSFCLGCIICHPRLRLKCNENNEILRNCVQKLFPSFPSSVFCPSQRTGLSVLQCCWLAEIQWFWGETHGSRAEPMTPNTSQLCCTGAAERYLLFSKHKISPRWEIKLVLVTFFSLDKTECTNISFRETFRFLACGWGWLRLSEAGVQPLRYDCAVINPATRWACLIFVTQTSNYSLALPKQIDCLKLLVYSHSPYLCHIC